MATTGQPNRGLIPQVFLWLRELPFFRKKADTTPSQHFRDETKTELMGDGVGGAISRWYERQLATPKTLEQLYCQMRELDSGDLPSAVLDLYSEDATARNPVTQKTIWISAQKNEQVQKLADDLLVRIDAEEESGELVRGAAGFGNDFSEIMTNNSSTTGQPAEVGYLKPLEPEQIRLSVDRELWALLGYGFKEKGWGEQDYCEPGDIRYQPWEILHLKTLNPLYIEV